MKPLIWKLTILEDFHSCIWHINTDTVCSSLWQRNLFLPL